MEQWLVENSLNLFGTLIGTGLWATAFTRREDVRTRRVANLLAITSNHRELWREYLNNERLARVRVASADISERPVTEHEHLFVNLVISHANSVFYANKDGLVIEYEGLRRDIAEFFSLPIPAAVWRKSKPLQNHDFAAFIDSSLR